MQLAIREVTKATVDVRFKVAVEMYMQVVVDLVTVVEEVVMADPDMADQGLVVRDIMVVITEDRIMEEDSEDPIMAVTTVITDHTLALV